MNPQILALLCDRGSLTGRFKQVMGATPRLTKLSQGMQFVSPLERRVLGIRPRQMALVREIKMGKGEQNWLFARTVVPLRTLTGVARRISMLNDTPIGKILFGRHGAARSSMHVELTLDYPRSVAQFDLPTDQLLWQRRSIFEFDSGPLMVREVFLPDCPIYES
ncbi:chorismate lyase [Aliikangiella marina]|uniref:Chorismate lyase n=1 Tax=Aliikangiella marina TaxID=1712262 RepID=A0A545T9D6_9GAMM|nr:chorismate lyase [Aliikangiella marina]TQV73818.1 chorismate lyase [Aliikangiella marina]